MHVCIISSDEDRPRPKLVKEGPRTYVYWHRAKTGRSLRQAVPPDMLPSIQGFLDEGFGRRKCISQYSKMVRSVGKRAGYENISPNTLRHTRCLRALMPRDKGGDGLTIYEAAHVLGCSLDVVVRDYAALSDEQYDSLLDGRKEGEGPVNNQTPQNGDARKDALLSRDGGGSA